ncbi:MAG: beta-propeller domain-containing protein [Candidatus Izemoplasmataceae bacterium]
MFSSFIEFIYNNFLIVSIIIVTLSLSFYFLQKVYREFMLNRKLHGFQRALRVAKLRFRKKRLSVLSFMIIIPMLFLIGIIDMNTEEDLEYTNHISKLASTSDVQTAYENYHDRFSGNNFDDMDDLANFEKVEALSDESIHFSDGFDDMDLIKYDQNYLYILNHEKLSILNANGAESSIHKEIYFDFDFEEKTFFPMGIYVDANRVIVIGNAYEFSYEYQDNTGINPALGKQSDAYIFVYDKNADFAQTTEYKIRGGASDVRKRNNQLILVIKEELPFDDTDLDIKDYLPNAIVNGVRLNTRFEDIIYVEGTKPNGFTTFVNINLDTFKVKQQVMLSDLSNSIFISNQSIYFSSNSYQFLEAADLFVTSNPIEAIRTAVSKLSFSEDGIDYVDTKMINGTILNQFAISENNGYVRLFTTEFDDDIMNHHLTILDSNLEVVGSLDQLGNDFETLKSVKFYGDYAYLITKDEVASFYVLNLSAPSNPKVESILDMRYFPTYLETIDQDNLVGIGYSKTEDDVINGLKISVYSITNPKEPIMVYEETMLFSEYGNASSEALYNPKLFYYSSLYQRLIIPLNNYDLRPSASQTAGLLIYHVSLEDGITYETFIQHPDETIPYTKYRGLFINDYLYSVSYNQVGVMHKDDLTTFVQVIDLYENENN